MAGDTNGDELKGSIDHTGGIEVNREKIEALYTRASLASLLKEEEKRIKEEGDKKTVEEVRMNYERQATFIHYLFDGVVSGKEDLVEGYDIPLDATVGEAYRILGAMVACGYSEEEVRERFSEIQPQFIDKQFERIQKHTSQEVFRGVGGGYYNTLEKYNALLSEGKLEEGLSPEEFEALLLRSVDPAHGEGRPLAYLVSQHPELFARWRDSALLQGEAQDYILIGSIYAQVKDSAFEEEPLGETSSISLGLRLIQASEYQPDDFQLSGEQRQLLDRYNFTVEEMYDIGKNLVLKHNLFNKKPSETDSEVPDYLGEAMFDDGINIMEYINYLSKEDGCFRSGSCAVLQKIITIEYWKDHESTSYGVADEIWRKWRSENKSLKELQDYLDAWALVLST